MIIGRELSRDEIGSVWTIDRREVIEAVYVLESGTLVLKPERYDMRGWPPGEAEKYTPILEACHDRGGWFLGLFEDDRLVGVAVLDSRFIGRDEDRLQLKFMHVASPCRHKGLGRRLFELAVGEARRRGARYLYISATPSESTIGFYLGLGCEVAAEPDPELFELEPDDIHLEYDLALCGDDMRPRGERALPAGLVETPEARIRRVTSERIDVVPYDPAWPERFELEKRHLLACLPPDLIVRVEHVGSTAVPGLAAKPIVDLIVEVTDLEAVKQRIVPVLESQGYEYFWRPQWDDEDSPHYPWFIKRDPATGASVAGLYSGYEDGDLDSRRCLRGC